MKAKSKLTQAWVVAVNMGYGHQRPAQVLQHLAPGGQVIVANNYPGIPAGDRRIWENTRKFYEFISRLTHVPGIGPGLFKIYDRLQAIPPFYPRRDLSKPSLQLQQIYRLIKNQRWGRHLINKLGQKPWPLVTTFPIIAFMAEAFAYPAEIYCLATDTDVSRAWVAKNPLTSRINYFAPNYRVVERLKEYGVKEGRIFLTGFPLPKDNIGGPGLKILRQDLAQRLANLDPQNQYCQRYEVLLRKYLKRKNLPAKSNHLLTLTFAVGGAGAQREIGALIISSLRQKIKEKKIRLVLVAGVHNQVSTYFRQAAQRCGLASEIGRGIEIIFASNKQDYFQRFNQAMRTTDILWTKPSELSFYTALGLPIIMAPPIGSQEIFNRKWLRTLGVAANQYQPRYTHEWLFDWVNSGWLAEAAMQGFIEAPKFGTYNIEKIISQKPQGAEKIKMALQY